MRDNPAAEPENPVGWVREHLRRYREAAGEEGHYLQGLPTLILTTTGRRSGLRRSTGATYGQFGDTYVVIASAGGAPRHPEWFLNVVEHPDVEVQVGSQVFSARARIVPAGEERDGLWRAMCVMSPLFADLQRMTDRLFPVIAPTSRTSPQHTA